MRKVVCVKWGDKYSSEYVNILYAMVKRNISAPFQFYCLTESSVGLHTDVCVLPLPDLGLHGWWYKLLLFQKDFYGLDGDILYIDLDMVIMSSIDDFFSYAPDQFCILEAFNRPVSYASGLMRFQIGRYSHVFDRFMRSKNDIMHSYSGGDQVWINEHIDHASFWPKEWIVSYKNSCVTRPRWSFGKLGAFLGVGARGIEKQPPPCKVLAFHGKPDPSDIIDRRYKSFKKAPWLRHYWYE